MIDRYEIGLTTEYEDVKAWIVTDDGYGETLYARVLEIVAESVDSDNEAEAAEAVAASVDRFIATSNQPMRAFAFPGGVLTINRLT